MSQPPLVIGHRGFRAKLPENTMAGFQGALALGVDAIEIDVHCTADGVPVVIHDATVDRTTDGSGAVAGLSLDQIRRFHAGVGQFGSAHPDERIPTLAETLDLTRGRCLLVVEIKAEGIERDVVRVLDGSEGDVMAWSFRPEDVKTMRELAPAIPCALLSPALNGRDPQSLFRQALRIGQQGVSLYHSSVDAALVRSATLRGLSVFTWTANEPDDHRRLIEAGVAGIVTDEPDRLIATLRGGSGEAAP
jgi:glycerophosphoryl diester phosphodiesterase